MPSVLAAHKWWAAAVIYQVYPRSFQDSNGDGIGDLPGIVSRLDYIVSLGVDTLWINPVYRSPEHDNGYDISDFQAIQSEYGTMAGLDALIAACHQRKMRVIMDMVVNHTSDEHEWFRQGAQFPRQPLLSLLYLVAPRKKAARHIAAVSSTPPGRSLGIQCRYMDSWYLHYFSKHQPDLNWDHAEARRVRSIRCYMFLA